MKPTMFRPAAPAAGDRRSSPGPRTRRQRPARFLAVAMAAPVMALALVLAACGSSGSSSSGTAASSASPGSGAKLTVADVAPFSGPDAALGPTYLASCYGATSAINAAGGVLGHMLTCKSVDTRGDPADAVPAVNQMFASTPSLALVIGCTSDEAASVAPIINSHKMAMFCMTGQSEFDHTHFPYFYRLVPPDLEESYAMTVIAKQLGYKRIALAFGNDIGSQTFIQPAIAALKKAGITLTTNQSLDLKATTFRTEAAAIVQSHPDAIMTEALGAADPTLFSEIKQLNGGKIIPIIGTSAAISPAFYKASASAVGANEFSSNFHADNLVVLSSGPAYQAFSKALLAQQGKVPGATGNFTTYLSAPGGVHLYDGMNLAALAMIMSKSTNPSVYGPDIIKIGDGVAGATVCYSFAQCAPLVKAGKPVKYVGPGGPTSFDSFHDSTGIFQIDTYTPSGQVKTVGTISTAQLRALSG
jgi:branched-chain amino acid transport system substrate-binding protein